jgi:TPR repeat protein
MDQCWTQGPHRADTPPGAIQPPADGDLRIATWIAAAAAGDASAAFDLGVACSTTGLDGNVDLVEAHKWFNLAAVAGHAEAKTCRAEIADEMTARDIAEAQRRAREWLRAIAKRAA